VSELMIDKMKVLLRKLRNEIFYIFYMGVDLKERLLNQRDKLVPPMKLRRLVGSTSISDFKSVGKDFLKCFIELGELKHNDKVLDVGCGVGRIAVALTQYLNEEGIYEGFDVDAEQVNWARKNIAPEFPNFHFRFVDIQNSNFNPKGKDAATNFNFPYPDNHFDFVFLTSVFTHMLLKEIERYLSEIVRVTKPNGKVLVTFFLLNKETEISKQNAFDFKYKIGDGVFTVDSITPESAVAYDEQLIRDLYKNHKLTVTEPIYYGFWSGRKSCLNGQDIVIARKLSPSSTANKTSLFEVSK